MIYLYLEFSVFFSMKNSFTGTFIFYFLFNCLVLISLEGVSQEMIKPIRHPFLLSGNFGELRATHFHSGIDIRTGGVEGLPVLCVKEGRLARVSVSPVGYGQALYIEHPDGTTTVYGHLQRFIPPIAELVRELQYEQESFRLDRDFRTYGIRFRQGDTIAYTGNTGSSGGPHLHFEIRNTQTERTINPLLFYPIRDNKAPLPRKLYLYTIDDAGCVLPLRQYSLKSGDDGNYRLGRIAVPAGRIGVGVYITDYMNDSWNKLGIYRMGLIVGKDTLFTLQMDSCAFDQNCFINVVKDFTRYKQKETVYRCFGNYLEQFPNISSRNKGYLEVAKDSLLHVELILTDINRNRSRVIFGLKGVENPYGAQHTKDILKYDEAHLLELPGCRVELPAGTLLASVEKTTRIEQDSLTGRSVFVLGDKEVPLFKKAHLVLSGVFSPQSIICEVDAMGKKYPLETIRTATALEAEIGYLSRYAVFEDLQAPELLFMGKFPDRTLRFQVKDDLSGLAWWRGEVNGKWCLFSYDPRVNLLQCSLTEPVFLQGQVNEVKVNVEDKVGNKRELIVRVRK